MNYLLNYAINDTSDDDDDVEPEASDAQLEPEQSDLQLDKWWIPVLECMDGRNQQKMTSVSKPLRIHIHAHFTSPYFLNKKNESTTFKSPGTFLFFECENLYACPLSRNTPVYVYIDNATT